MIDRERLFSPAFRYLPERYLHPSIATIRKKAEQLLIETNQLNHHPIDLTPIMEKCGVKNIRYYGLGAKLIPEKGEDGKGNFAIVLEEPSSSPEEERVDVAHEIGHTFFYSRDGKPPFHRVPPLDGYHEEHFCEIFARELLIPKDLVENEVANLTKPGEAKFRAESLIKLAGLFKVPKESLARRLVEDLGVWEAIIFQLECSQQESFYPGEWLIKWIVPYDTVEPVPKYHFPPVGVHLSTIALETLISRQRIFKSKLDDLLPAAAETYFPQNCQNSWEQIKDKGEVLVFTTSNLDENTPIQLPLFKWYELKSKGYSWFPYFREIAQIVCVIPLK